MRPEAAQCASRSYGRLTSDAFSLSSTYSLQSLEVERQPSEVERFVRDAGVSQVGDRQDGLWRHRGCWVRLAEDSEGFRRPPFYAGRWHTYGVNWEPGEITFYYDGSAPDRTRQQVVVLTARCGSGRGGLAAGRGGPHSVDRRSAWDLTCPAPEHRRVV